MIPKIFARRSGFGESKSRSTRRLPTTRGWSSSGDGWECAEPHQADADLTNAETARNRAEREIKDASRLDPRLLELKRDLREAERKLADARHRLDISEGMKTRWSFELRPQKSGAKRMEKAMELMAG